MMHLFHITTQLQWQQAQQLGEYWAESLETEGFIHTSKRDQVLWVANQFYRGQPDLVLLTIDPAKVRPVIRYETVPDVPVDSEFPHIYGPLNLDAVVTASVFTPGADGLFDQAAISNG